MFYNLYQERVALQDYLWRASQFTWMVAPALAAGACAIRFLISAAIVMNACSRRTNKRQESRSNTAILFRNPALNVTRHCPRQQTPRRFAKLTG